VRKPGVDWSVRRTCLLGIHPSRRSSIAAGPSLVLSKIDAILAWEARHENERDTRFVELDKYLCEVRAGQYWRLENVKSSLERRFPESRRKAYYMMSIREHLPPQVRRDLKQVGWTKGLELASWLASRASTSKVQPGCTEPGSCQKKSSSGQWRRS
jgi:hypothetical protein